MLPYDDINKSLPILFLEAGQTNSWRRRRWK